MSTDIESSPTGKDSRENAQGIPSPLPALPNQLRDAQEMERRRVAREMDSSVHQILSTVKFRLQAIEERLAGKYIDAWRDTLKAEALLERAIDEVRHLTSTFEPGDFEKPPTLGSSLRSFCAELSERSQLQVELEVRDLPERLPADLELNVCRIVQEALTNIRKRAQARCVIVRIGRQGQHHLRVSIHDDGSRFPHEADARAGDFRPAMGLLDIQERAVLAGGSLQVASDPKRGSQIELLLPLPAFGHSYVRAAQ
ncbi:MAG TPA: ATP-binding protein [Verrucomicrobiae bacterium]